MIVFENKTVRAASFSACFAMSAVFTACGGNAAPETDLSTAPKPVAAQSQEQSFDALTTTSGLKLFSAPQARSLAASTSSPAILLGTTTLDDVVWNRVLLANGQIAWTPGKILKAQISPGLIKARAGDIDASNIPKHEREDEGFEWQDWASPPTLSALQILEVSEGEGQETPAFIKAQGRALEADETIRTLGAAAPFLWPQIKVKNGDALSWISLTDIEVSSTNTLEFRGLINQPFLSAAISQLGLGIPDGSLTFENLAHQKPSIETVDSAGFSIQQMLLAPENTKISYILCLGNARGDSIYHIQWQNNISRSIGFYDTEFRVSTPLLMGYETISGVGSDVSTLILNLLQISGDEQPLMKVYISGSVTADQVSVVNNVEF